MKIVGTFDSKQLYYQQKAAKRDSSFAGTPAFDSGKKTGGQDATALISR